MLKVFRYTILQTSMFTHHLLGCEPRSSRVKHYEPISHELISTSNQTSWHTQNSTRNLKMRSSVNYLGNK